MSRSRSRSHRKLKLSSSPSPLLSVCSRQVHTCWERFMAIVVEDGSGKADANSYVSVSTCVDYLTTQGLTTGFVALLDAAREPIVHRGVRWLESHYRLRWKGQRADVDQGLGWPRTGVSDEDQLTVRADIVPQEVQDALCLAIDREAAGAGTLDPDLDRGGQIQEETIGPLTIKYAKGAPSKTLFPAVTDLLTGLTKSSLTTAIRRT